MMIGLDGYSFTSPDAHELYYVALGAEDVVQLQLLALWVGCAAGANLFDPRDGTEVYSAIGVRLGMLLAEDLERQGEQVTVQVRVQGPECRLCGILGADITRDTHGEYEVPFHRGCWVLWRKGVRNER